MTEARSEVLFLCYGNPARLDDALGATFAAELERRLSGVADIDVDYQLGIEHALDVANHECVIFVDASLGCPAPFSFDRIVPRLETSFTTHSLQPEDLMGLASTLFGARTRGYALGIRGYQFGDFGERLSDGARRNLDAALRFALERLQARDFDEAARAGLATAAECCRDGV